MKQFLSAALALAVCSCAVPAAAQTTAPRHFNSNGILVDATGVFQVDAAGAPSVSRREVFMLATANVATAGATVYGGAYILNQVCSTYGTVTFQAIGPDNATYQTVATYTAAPAGGGVAVSLGSYQAVRVTLSGTAGCNVKLSRVPA